LSIRDKAVAHWKYTENIMKLTAKAAGEELPDELSDLMQYLYVEAMLHGYKHGRADWE